MALLDVEAPDVVLLDLGLPDIDGVQVIRHATRHRPQCEVLVVTMFEDDQHVLPCIEAGATGYLLKDASAERIIAAIHELLAGGSPSAPASRGACWRRFASARASQAWRRTGRLNHPHRCPSAKPRSCAWWPKG
jgi:DNA-binding NarL/FixJ family response regulator